MQRKCGKEKTKNIRKTRADLEKHLKSSKHPSVVVSLLEDNLDRWETCGDFEPEDWFMLLHPCGINYPKTFHEMDWENSEEERAERCARWRRGRDRRKEGCGRGRQGLEGKGGVWL